MTVTLDRILNVQKAMLLRLLGWMMDRVGGAAAGQVPTLDRATHLALLRTVRGAESAVRRLILVQARGLALGVRLRSRLAGGSARGGERRAGERGACFPLLDPRKRFPELDVLKPAKQRGEPRITMIGVDEWIPQPEPRRVPRAPLNAASLVRRLRRLETVLHDLPRQAKRLARWRARQAARAKAGLTHVRHGVVRPGWPPGYRRDGREPVHAILRECQRLARWAEAEDVAA